jgi:hypothetical protein
MILRSTRRGGGEGEGSKAWHASFYSCWLDRMDRNMVAALVCLFSVLPVLTILPMLTKAGILYRTCLSIDPV